jgi:hypothetical protein
LVSEFLVNQAWNGAVEHWGCWQEDNGMGGVSCTLPVYLLNGGGEGERVRRWEIG